jgi:hypothetical protein
MDDSNTYELVVQDNNHAVDKDREDGLSRLLRSTVSSKTATTQSLSIILDRFSPIRAILFPAKNRPFNRDTFTRKAREYYAKYNFPTKHKVNNGLRSDGARQQIVINNVATLNANRFFRDSENNFISVRDDKLAREAQRLGYVEFHMSHIMTMEQIP